MWWYRAMQEVDRNNVFLFAALCLVMCESAVFTALCCTVCLSNVLPVLRMTHGCVVESSWCQSSPSCLVKIPDCPGVVRCSSPKSCTTYGNAIAIRMALTQLTWSCCKLNFLTMQCKCALWRTRRTEVCRDMTVTECGLIVESRLSNTELALYKVLTVN